MSFSWTVIHGKKLGRTIGYPTANIELAPWLVEDGVYALKIEFDDTTYAGMWTYRENITLFEAHVFDFSWDLYEKTLIITIVWKIRDNRKFESLDELKMQIQKDQETAKSFAF